MPNVTMIPATKNKFTALPVDHAKKRRVAGYARVSTDSEEQLTSYEAQVDYYTNYIRSNPDWEFVEVYTDEGISAVNTKRRDGFNRMIHDAMNGRIDLIVTKSVSRFARNTVDSLTTIRKLKGIGCECYFQKENIYTFDGKGELLLTIMSSLAQEESRSISENVTWGQRKRFADGKVTMPYKQFLGYEKGEDGLPKVVEAEAEIVRTIYRLFREGKTPLGICAHLEGLGIPSPSGRSKWSKTTVVSILTNEKYKGEALLQKSFTVDFLEKKMKKNEGEVPQYYVEHSHPAIIPPEEWEEVQAEFARRKALGASYSGKSPLAAKLICEDCGGFYGAKVWHSTDKYRRVVWHCNEKFKDGVRCETPTLSTEQIQQMFVIAYNQLMSKRVAVLQSCEEIRKAVLDCTPLDAEIERQEAEMQVSGEMIRTLIQENATKALSQEAYDRKYASLMQRYQAAAAELEQLQAKRADRKERSTRLAQFMRTRKKQPDILTDWDDTLWTAMVEKGIVHRSGAITFKFYNGSEVAVGA